MQRNHKFKRQPKISVERKQSNLSLKARRGEAGEESGRINTDTDCEAIRRVEGRKASQKAARGAVRSAGEGEEAWSSDLADLTSPGVPSEGGRGRGRGGDTWSVRNEGTGTRSREGPG